MPGESQHGFSRVRSWSVGSAAVFGARRPQLARAVKARWPTAEEWGAWRHKLVGQEAAEREQTSYPRPAQKDAWTAWARSGADRCRVYVTGENDPSYNCLEWAMGSTRSVLAVDSGSTLTDVLAAYGTHGYEQCAKDEAEIDLWGGRDPRPENRIKGPNPGRFAAWEGTVEAFERATEDFKVGSAPTVVAHASRKPSDPRLDVQAGRLDHGPDGDIEVVHLGPDVWESKLGQMERVTHPRHGPKGELSVGLMDSIGGYGDVIAHLRKRSR